MKVDPGTEDDIQRLSRNYINGNKKSTKIVTLGNEAIRKVLMETQSINLYWGCNH